MSIPTATPTSPTTTPPILTPPTAPDTGAADAAAPAAALLLVPLPLAWLLLAVDVTNPELAALLVPVGKAESVEVTVTAEVVAVPDAEADAADWAEAAAAPRKLVASATKPAATVLRKGTQERSAQPSDRQIT